MSRFIALTHVGRHGKKEDWREDWRKQFFMVGKIVTWYRPPNGQPGSVVVTVDTKDEGWHVSQSPEQIAEMIEGASE